ncbi:unnamed protein product [Paramecium primaurelia]|uniref:Uncharacterized protein n=1 Tax=Paramecium primaurelia TaxID=5886 RepID=A0A8S1NSP4_PARPR|nr:unnamed protein product [Paramecium primaurelia]CAD8116911.1 unnamed protein product [Paramecium primaurelia]
MPAMRNCCYLKLNSTALFNENLTQENSFLGNWKKQFLTTSSKLIIIYIFEYNKLQEMIKKFDEFTNIKFTCTHNNNKLKQKFMELQNRDVFYLGYQEKFRIKKNRQSHTLLIISKRLIIIIIKQRTHKRMKNFQKYKLLQNLDLGQPNGQFKRFQDLTKERTIYNKNFQVFQDLFKNQRNLIYQYNPQNLKQQEQNQWRLYFHCN